VEFLLRVLDGCVVEGRRQSQMVNVHKGATQAWLSLVRLVMIWPLHVRGTRV
jgi:hypothetical protein